MSITARRILSWGGLLALIVGGAWLVTLLPGSGGVAGELRWRLARPLAAGDPTAFLLVVKSEERTPGSSRKLLAPLLKSPDATLAGNALSLLTDLIALRRWTARQHPDPDLWAAFNEWFEAAPDAQRRRNRVDLVKVLTQFEEHPETVSQPKYCRWLVGATLRSLRFDRGAVYRILTDVGVFHADVPARLCVLDGRIDQLRAADTPRDYDIRDPASWPALSAGGVIALISDPVPEIRWAAGRVLAVCRDERSLPVMAEWLRTDRRAPAAAGAVMDRLFGPEWRTPFESGDAASMPSARDRRGRGRRADRRGPAGVRGSGPG